MATREVLALNTTTPQIEAPQTGDTYLMPREVAITAAGSTPALKITQTGSGGALLVEDSASTDATPFVIDADGNVITGATASIDTTAQASALAAKLQLHGTSLATSAFGAFRWANSAAARPNFVMSKSRGTSAGTHATVSVSDEIGAIVFNASDGASFVNAAQISAVVDGTPGTNDMPGRLVFSTTADGASSPTERMRIDSNGAVGIGSTALTANSLRVGKAITGGTTGVGIVSLGTIQPDVTSTAYYVYTIASTAANGGTPYTTGFLYHYRATQGTFHADSTVTRQYGFEAGSTLVGAANNYGFYSDIAAASGRWNFYANGTANNYLGGNLGIGSTTFGTSSTKTLCIGSGTAPSDAPADTIQLYSSDLSAGNTILSLYTEGTCVSANTGTTNLASRIAVRVNGTVYYLLAASAA